MKKYFLCILLLLLSPSAFSGVHCSEKATQVILHKDGQLYFMTDQTCSAHWCQVKWTGQGDKDRLLSLLLTAQTTQKPLVFYWADIANCSQKNVVYSSPEYVVLM